MSTGTRGTGNYKKDWVARKPFYILQMGERPGTYFLQINERRLVTKTPYVDLINSLEEMLATARNLKETHAIDPVS